jgi:hypothetical protein
MVRGGFVELTSPARKLVETFGTLIAAAVGTPSEAESYALLAENWSHHWSQVFEQPVAGEQYWLRTTTWSEDHNRIEFEPPLKRPPRSWGCDELLSPAVGGGLLLDLGIRLGALGALHPEWRPLSWLSPAGRRTFLRKTLRGISPRQLAQIAEVSLSTAQRWFSGVRPTAANLKRLFRLPRETPPLFSPELIRRIRVHYACVAALEVLASGLPGGALDELCATLSAVADETRALIGTSTKEHMLVSSPGPLWSDPLTTTIEDVLKAIGKAGLPVASVAAHSVLEMRVRQLWIAESTVMMTTHETSRIKFPPMTAPELELILRGLVPTESRYRR